MVDEQKKLHKIYTEIKGKEKLLAPKSNNLYKHPVEVGRPYSSPHKIKRSKNRCLIGLIYG